MKMIFVDAENIGLKKLEKIAATVIDRVFVFSKSEAIKFVCEKSLFLCLSDYPTAPNQADFYIIAYLSRVLSALDKKQLKSIHFELYSNDESLIAAFEFQCKQLGATSNSIRTKEDTIVHLPELHNTTPEDKLFVALKSPHPLNPDLQKQLGLSKSDFSKAITTLSKAKKIQRSPENKRKWARC